STLRLPWVRLTSPLPSATNTSSSSVGEPLRLGRLGSPSPLFRRRRRRRRRFELPPSPAGFTWIWPSSDIQLLSSSGGTHSLPGTSPMPLLRGVFFDVIAIALLGEEELALHRELLLLRVGRDDRVEERLVLLGTQDATQALGL